MKSLIVEDDFSTRRLMEIHLKQFGEYSVATNGAEGVKAVEKAIEDNDPYDLICLDIMMPVMDGMEALEKIREVEKKHGIEGLDGVKIIMTTAKNMSKDIFGAFKKGCESYLVKPVKKDALIAELEKLGLLETKPQA